MAVRDSKRPHILLLFEPDAFAEFVNAIRAGALPSLPGSCETPRVSTGFLAKGGIGDPCVRVHLL
jgi:hypothetical protein